MFRFGRLTTRCKTLNTFGRLNGISNASLRWKKQLMAQTFVRDFGSGDGLLYDNSFGAFIKSIKITDDTTILNRLLEEEETLKLFGKQRNHDGIVSYGEKIGIKDEFTRQKLSSHLIQQYSPTEEQAKRSFHRWSTVIWRDSVYYVDRKLENEVYDVLVSRGRFGNFGVIGGRQTGKSSCIYQSAQKALTQGIPVLYGQFRENNGDHKIEDCNLLYKRIMEEYCRWIYRNNMLPKDLEFSHDESGLRNLIEELCLQYHQPVSLILDELQVVRGDQNGAKRDLKNFVDELRNDQVVKCFIGAGPTGVLRSDTDGLSVTPDSPSLWQFERTFLNRDLFLTETETQYIFNEWYSDVSDLVSISDINKFGSYIYRITQGYPSFVQNVGDYLDLSIDIKKNFEFINEEQFHTFMIENNHLENIYKQIASNETFSRIRDFLKGFSNDKQHIMTLNWFLLQSKDSNDIITLDTTHEHKMYFKSAKELSRYGILFPVDASFKDYVVIPMVLRDIIRKVIENFGPSLPDYKLHKYFDMNNFYVDFGLVCKELFSDSNFYSFREDTLVQYYLNAQNGISEYGYQFVFNQIFKGYQDKFDEINVRQSSDNKDIERPDFIITRKFEYPESKKIIVELLIQQGHKKHNSHYHKTRNNYVAKVKNCVEGWVINIDESQEKRNYQNEMIGVGKKKPDEDENINVVYVRLDTEKSQMKELIVNSKRIV